MACAQTGSGKTAAFLVPIISTLLTKIKNGRVKPIRQVPGGKPFKASPLALILLPTRELAIQIFDEARRFTYKTNLRPAVVYGGADVRAQVQKMSGGCDILVATAGRLKDMIQRGHVSLSHVRHLVLDEADRMLDMGFGPDIREIVNKSSMPQDEGRQTLMFSATFPREVQILAKDFLKVDYVRLRIGRIGGTTKSIKQRILYVQDPDKRDTLVDILMSQSPTRTLIFMETKRAADSLDDYLFNLKFPTVSIHGDRDQHERESALKAFRDGRSPILIATAVASRGLDIKDVNHVINYELPKDIDDYIHRIGRTARAGNQGLATSFYNDRNELIAPQLTKILQECSQEVPDFLKAYVSENTTYEANDDFVEESDEQILGAGPSSSGAVWNMTEADSNWGSGGCRSSLLPSLSFSVASHFILAPTTFLNPSQYKKSACFRMDSSFWTRIRKSVMTAPKKQPTSLMQQTRFHHCWASIQNGFSTPEKRSLQVQQTDIPLKLKTMVDLLVDEESSLDDEAGTTGVCMEYLFKHAVLTKLVNNAEGDQPRGIMGETIRTIASMINLLDDKFLIHNAVHKPTVKLLRTCASSSEPQGEIYHEDLVDLMYILCSKIHGYPDLLNIFFHDKQWLTVPQRARQQKNLETIELVRNLRIAAEEDKSADGDSSAAASATEQKEHPAPTLPESKSDYEFLLFAYLSQFVHREGKAGDFARTGLLFIMELATGSLGEYVQESQFASVLIAGVGGLYSQLPRKLIVRGGPSTINSMVGTLNNRAPPTESSPSRRANIEVSTSPDFQSRLDAFLKVLEFCQDIMMRCPNAEIVSALLVTFKSVFLENILYPSILECSDTDGSSVAVISYIDLILQVLEHEALVDLVVGFLMASDEDESRPKEGQDTEDAFAEVQNPQSTSPYFMASGRFTLKDLVLSRLKSRSQPTVIATLKLLNTIITRHCKYSLKLLSIQPDDKTTLYRDATSDPSRPGQDDLPMINHHVHELDLFYALISTINPNNTAEIFCNGYESYLRDAEASVETHQCFLQSKEIKGGELVPGQLSAADRKKQRRRSMKYGHRMDLPEDLSGEDFIRSLEESAQTGEACCEKSGQHSIPMHRLLPSDPLLQILLGTLSHFFAHSVELNLALTGVITSLAVCPYRSLEGWLLFKSSDVKASEDENEQVPAIEARFELGDSDDEDTLPVYLTKNNHKTKGAGKETTTESLDSATTISSSAFKSFPPFFTMLRTLTQQVDYYRSEIDGFDQYLADRRSGLLVATELNSVIHHTPGLAPSPHIPQYHPQPQHSGAPNVVAQINPRSSSLPGMTPAPGTGPSAAAQRMHASGMYTPGTSAPSSPQSSPMVRKSGSPSSALSAPSNMPSMGGAGRVSAMNNSYNTPASSPIAINQSKNVATTGASSSYTSSALSNSFGSRLAAAAGGAPAPQPGTVASSWGSMNMLNSGVNPALVKTMDTMMIKPLFPDGFVNDSDTDSVSELSDDDDSNLDVNAALPRDEDPSQGHQDEGRRTQSKSASGSAKERKARQENSTSSISSATAAVGGEGELSPSSEKTVPLSQLLTNVVILEEVVKEVVAMAQVRRGLGVDKVRFL
ncbi:hypothetical protein EMPS_10365 [Entomortierella parvispora]|uniref:RNA helicase n=1 Tax=Entomortierella parvispora TaxID=205924 RepID=A0A9P3HJZ3_9FUNG|nr:hypothetical protein EMPS_10365 [Entomortierella parvispora]